jgi:hypothetical protein
VVGFWYRQHRSEFWVDSFLPGPEIGNDMITYDLPSNTEPGMIRTFLDPQGRLLQLEVRPFAEQAEDGSSPEVPSPNWRQLFAEADLDPDRFKPVPAISVPPVAADMQMAWKGTFAQAPRTRSRWMPHGGRADPYSSTFEATGDADRSFSPQRLRPNLSSNVAAESNRSLPETQPTFFQGEKTAIQCMTRSTLSALLSRPCQRLPRSATEERLDGNEVLLERQRLEAEGLRTLSLAVKNLFDQDSSSPLALSKLLIYEGALNCILFTTNLLRQFAGCQSADGASQLFVPSLVFRPQGDELPNGAFRKIVGPRQHIHKIG